MPNSDGGLSRSPMYAGVIEGVGVRHRSETLGQASRISLITPTAVSLLMTHLKKKLA